MLALVLVAVLVVVGEGAECWLWEAGRVRVLVVGVGVGGGGGCEGDWEENARGMELVSRSKARGRCFIRREGAGCSVGGEKG